jgi:hypothetical protein
VVVVAVHLNQATVQVVVQVVAVLDTQQQQQQRVAQEIRLVRVHLKELMVAQGSIKIPQQHLLVLVVAVHL